MYRTILVPLDGSARAGRVLPHAAEFARRFGATLVLLRATDPASSGLVGIVGGAAPGDLHPDEGAAYLTRMQDQVRAAGLNARVQLVSGPPESAIVAQMHELGADLVILAIRGRSSIERFVFGSVPAAVARQAPCPVLLIRPGRRKEEALSYERILALIDTFQQAEAVADCAAELATAFGAALTLMQATLPAYAARAGSGPGPSSHALVAGERLQNAVRLREIATQLRARGLAVDDTTGAGETATVFVRHARKVNADLAVLRVPGSIGIGAYVDEVVRRAPCPVLLLPSSNREDLDL